MKILILLLLLPFSVFAEELKVITWNTFLIAPPWNSTHQGARTNLMSKLLPTLDQDVMFFQETFYDKKRNQIIRALKGTHPYVAVPRKGRKLRQFQDSGLMVASRLPMRVLDQVVFKNCAQADCLASKSAILVEVTLPSGQKAQFANTHLQAWDTKKTIAVRRKQLAQIKKMLNKHFQHGIAQFLVGDFNIDGNEMIEYPASVKFMDMMASVLNDDSIHISNGFSTTGCFKKPGGDTNEWLDHLWLKPNGTRTQVVSLKVSPILGTLNGRSNCPLSDHFAVEAIVQIE